MENKCMDLMSRMGMIKHYNKRQNIYEYAFDNSFIEDETLTEDKVDNEESQKVKEMILSNHYWIRNQYEQFLESLNRSTRKPFLSKYTAEELKNHNVQTYQLNGYHIGYALKPDEDGVDIISVHNNEPNIKGVGDALIESAKANGGTKLDHYDGFLSDLYSKHGFEEYDRYKWDDQYADPNWDYERYGRPDVILRKLKKVPQQ
jgi:hypothetical protein